MDPIFSSYRSKIGPFPKSLLSWQTNSKKFSTIYNNNSNTILIICSQSPWTSTLPEKGRPTVHFLMPSQCGQQANSAFLNFKVSSRLFPSLYFTKDDGLFTFIVFLYIVSMVGEFQIHKSLTSANFYLFPHWPFIHTMQLLPTLIHLHKICFPLT